MTILGRSTHEPLTGHEWHLVAAGLLFCVGAMAIATGRVAAIDRRPLPPKPFHRWITGRRANRTAPASRRQADDAGLQARVALLRSSPWVRFSTVGLIALLSYLLVGEAVSPGFTDYWGYQVIQVVVVLVIVLALSMVFVREGGLAGYTHLAVVSTVCVDTLGNVEQLYGRWPVYDKITHFCSGIALTAVAANVLAVLGRRGTFPVSWAVRLALAMTFTLVVNIGWETYEYLGDVVFNTGRHQSSLDTTYDFVSDTMGAFVAFLLLWRFDPDAASRTTGAPARAQRAWPG